MASTWASASASAAAGQGSLPVEKQIAETTGSRAEDDDFPNDVEEGTDMVDIDRIERVYRSVLALHDIHLVRLPTDCAYSKLDRRILPGTPELPCLRPSNGY